MRFGRRNRSPFSWSRWSANTAEKRSPEPEPIPDTGPTVSPFTPFRPIDSQSDFDNAVEEPVMTSDPTQRLLTSLGRFQRQYLKAKSGIPQEQWSDECMNYLIQCVEIAVEQKWQELIEALTETGRVLQTYENAGRANECVPFLADSYEVLLLMAGDLIVNRRRSGVIRKWRERYAIAVDDIEASGLRLVRDTDDAGRYKHSREQVQLEAEREFAAELEELDARGSAASSEDEIELGEMPVVEDVPAEVSVDASESGIGAPAPRAKTDSELDSEITELLDTLCDCLVRIEQENEKLLAPVFASMEMGLSSLAERANERGWKGSAVACEAMDRMRQLVAGNRSARDDRFFELAYAFGGVYGDALGNTDDAVLKNWLGETEDYLSFWADRPATEESAAPVSVDELQEQPFAEPDIEAAPTEQAQLEVPTLDDVWGADRSAAIDTAEELIGKADDIEEESVPVTMTAMGADNPAAQLLDTAREAVVHGSIGDAKLLAMQAAVSIAQSQAAEAEARVRLAESRIQEGVRAIEAARQQVQQAEISVADSESQVGECRAGLAERGRHTQAVQNSLEGIESRIGEIERRLRELQAQLEEAQRQRSASLEAAEEARRQEENAKNVLEDAVQAEETARVRLEDARQHVKQLQRKQAEYEAAMERAREGLNRQRASVVEIEQTIEQIRSAEGVGKAEGDDLLF